MTFKLKKSLIGHLRWVIVRSTESLCVMCIPSQKRNTEPQFVLSTHKSTYLRLCIQNNRGSCRWGWTTFSSTSSRGLLLRKKRHRLESADANLQETPQPHMPHLVGIISLRLDVPPNTLPPPRPQSQMPTGNGKGVGGWDVKRGK